MGFLEPSSFATKKTTLPSLQRTRVPLHGHSAVVERRVLGVASLQDRADRRTGARRVERDGVSDGRAGEGVERGHDALLSFWCCLCFVEGSEAFFVVDKAGSGKSKLGERRDERARAVRKKRKPEEKKSESAPTKSSCSFFFSPKSNRFNRRLIVTIFSGSFQPSSRLISIFPLHRCYWFEFLRLSREKESTETFLNKPPTHENMMRRFAAVLLLVACAAAAGAVAPAAASAVRDLADDAAFEHVTQASTGQTTGTWLVAFAPGGATGALRAALNAVSAASSRAVLTASVDTLSAKATAARFFGSGDGDAAAASQKRAVILFKDRLMFEYPGSLAPHEGLADELLAFARSPPTSEGKEVPRPATALDGALRAAREAVAPALAKIEALLSDKVAPALEPLAAKVRPHLEKAGVSESAAAAAGLGAALAAAVAVALAGKRAANGSSGGRAGGRSSSSAAGKRSVATRQSSRRSTTKRA